MNYKTKNMCIEIQSSYRIDAYYHTVHSKVSTDEPCYTRHRNNKSTVIFCLGSKYWMVASMYHREAGPAVIDGKYAADWKYNTFITSRRWD